MYKQVKKLQKYNFMNNVREKVADLGIVLALSGISCMAIVKGVIGENARILSVFIFCLSLVLLYLARNKKNIIYINKDISLLLLYGFIVVIVSLCSDVDFERSGAGFYYQLGYFLQLIFVWNIYKNWTGLNFVKYGFYINGIFVLLSLILLIQMPGGILGFNNYISEDGEYLFDREAIGKLSFSAFVFSFFFETNNRASKIIKYIIVGISIFVLFISTRRSVMLAAILSLFLFYDAHKSVNIASICKIFLIMIFIGIAIFSNELLMNLVNASVERFLNAFATYFAGNASDMAVSVRVDLRNELFYKFSQLTILEILFGKGYMEAFVDFPLLQSFFDLGIFGGMLYFVTQCYLSVKYIFYKNYNTKKIIVMKCFVILSVIECFANGFPYGVGIYIVILMRMIVADDICKRVEIY